jgi:hypothetical protein
LSAACEYFRSLWAGAFSEASSMPEVLVDDLVEARVADALIQIVYGVDAYNGDMVTPRLASFGSRKLV